MTTAVPSAGWTGLMLGLAGSVVLAVLGFLAQHRPGAVRRRQLLVGAGFMLGGSVLAMAALQVALLTDNFAVSYVAENHSRATSTFFSITGAWAALEGSLVLWVLVLSGFTAAVMHGVRDTDDRLGTGALGVLGSVGAFFFGLVVLAGNPFEILAEVPADGPGPNPILADHVLMAVHPPLLYVGYVGLTVPFAFAMSALLGSVAGVEWLRRTRRANLTAWSFLTAGLVVGAWWSYEVLGWGGYWAWDPVENAALVPWLVATAFLHSAVVQVRRGMLQSWNFVLVLAAFALTVLGTFLTRSAVVQSVHSFSQSDVGPPLLVFFVVVVVTGFVLIALRAERIASRGGPESLASREGMFLLNNLLLSLFAFVVLLGTLYPVVLEAITAEQVSVGRPFFDRMAVPLGFALLLAMWAGPVTPYRHASPAVVWRRLRVPLLLAACAATTAVLAGVRSPGVLAVVALATGIASSTVRQALMTAPARTPAGLWRLICGQRGYSGGQLAHLGVALFVVVVATSSGLAERSTVTVDRGESVEFAGYTLTFDYVDEHELPDRLVTDAHLTVTDGERVVREMSPLLNSFPGRPQAVGNPDVWTTPTQDVYVALGNLEPERVTLNLFRYPLMVWMWVGGGMVAAGGFWALGRPRRTARTAVDPGMSRSGEPVNSDA
ncbi:cytochrome C biogenesis protein CcmF (plasmid) [Pseudonocardia sp. EC080610-09]|uniref:heme lyase CcmF/NrfE family subunit n=1 Tax=unclassified Pseudonocardia TaxID=2619320 RepID=UPI0006CB3784|nr:MULTISPECIES: cytochrome c-type biogenesis CcmF C-terminal domain-containing protein [unclassified Pseudonocardia]ALE76957.1 cytochrome C biogenesis protein CcmF [Pseudonocardia sp. EC080625-04]ALL79639.1 cytochrome C biogenesis protein CcmF [Pseudonocardia sp. EC080610-09]ALL85403.1 cytochrome C biogenesis protein CcmF [Pseudonocardia sp. EC080619-01]